MAGAAGCPSVVLSVGHLARRLPRWSETGEVRAVVAYSDEGEKLRGTGGPLRLAGRSRLLDEAFFLLYGDSYLPIDLAPVWRTSEEEESAR